MYATQHLHGMRAILADYANSATLHRLDLLLTESFDGDLIREPAAVAANRHLVVACLT